MDWNLTQWALSYVDRFERFLHARMGKLEFTV
jgi:hypothetical protein